MESIKLASNILIEYYGKDTLSVSDFENYTELIISGNGSEIDTDDARIFQNDLLSIFELSPATYELQLNNIDMTNISIDWLLRETPHPRIVFEGSDKIFELLKNKKVEVSDITKYSLGFNNEGDISEFDIYETLKTQKRFNLLPIIDIEDLDLALKYIDISEVKFKIRTSEDFEKLQSLANGKTIEIHVDVNDLKNIEALRNQTNFKINLDINDMSELSIEDLEYLKGYNISSISIQQDLDGAMDNPYELHLGMLSNSKEKYDLETYIKLRKAVDEVIQGIDIDSPDIEKFLTVYSRLGNKIHYDHEEDDRINPETGFAYIGGYPPNHNLIGGLLNNICVCEGYSKILKQCLSCVGIDSKIIIGYASRENHAWNQVKLDNIWYNVDLTWDAVNIKENRELDYCLQSDVDFIGHSMESFIASPSEFSYDRNYMHKYLGIPFAFDFEDKSYSPSDVISLLQKLNQFSTNGTRIEINQDSSSGNYALYLGNVINDDVTKYSYTQIQMTPENLATFIQEYLKTFHISQIQPSATSSLVSTTEGVELHLDENIKFDMLNYGISIDKLLKPSKINITSLIDISSINIWSRISNYFKTAFSQIQEKMLSKKEADIIKENKPVNIPKPQKLPSWDLRNWPDSEFQLQPIRTKNKNKEKGKEKVALSDDDLNR